MFMKSNLDYENRLRGHMYQLEDDSNQVTQAEISPDKSI